MNKTQIKKWTTTLFLCLTSLNVSSDTLTIDLDQFSGENPTGINVNDFLSISPVYVTEYPPYHIDYATSVRFTFDSSKVYVTSVSVNGRSNNSVVEITATGSVDTLTLQTDGSWSEVSNLSGIGNIGSVDIVLGESVIDSFTFEYSPILWRDGCHVILAGDYNDDSITDLYLQAVLQDRPVNLPYAIGLNVKTTCEIGDVVLQADVDGNYSLIYPPDPTVTAAVPWSPANYVLLYDDTNNDGRQDILLQAQNASDTSIVLSALSVSQAPEIIRTTVGGGTDPIVRTTVDSAAGNSYSKAGSSYVGTLQGDFSVTSNGKPNYSVPIAVPPSIQDVAPGISLVYNGGSANDILGVGWHLEGLSKIERCMPTIAQDRYSNAVNFNSSDKFCLNGQRLVVVNGAYGGNGAEYRTENESFSKIVSYGIAGNGPQYFRVWRANGKIEEYGNTSNSRRETQSSASVVEWGINEVADREGNAANFTYVNNKASGYFYINSVDFNGNSVVFGYESRTDITPSYANGALSVLPVRIDNITTRVSGSSVRIYNIGYGSGAATGRSRLTSIQECLSDGCKPVTTFGWDQGNESVAFTKQSTQTGSYTGGAVYDRQQYHLADVNGDGRSDLIWTYRYGNALGRVLYTANSTGTGFTQKSAVTETGFAASIINEQDQQYITGDVNGDGRSDLVWIGRLNGDVYRVIYLANSAGTGFDSQGYEVDVNSDYSLYENGQYQLADVNGDGRSDLVWTFLYKENFGRVVYLAHTDSSNRISLEKTTFDIDADYSPSAYDNHNFQTGDVNGDGKADLVWTFTYLDNLVRVLYLANSNGTAFIKTSLQKDIDIFPSATLYRDQKFHLGDVNADGKADLVWTYNYNNQLGRNVYLSTALGTSFTRKSKLLDAASGSFLPNNHTYPQTGLADLNGDGRKDLVYTYNNGTAFGYKTYLADMDGEAFSVGPASTSNDANANLKNQHYLLGDINADGKTDMVWAYTTSTNGLGRVAYTLPASHPDHVVGITDGFGLQTNIKYRYLADNSTGFYTRGNSAQYPVRDDLGLSYLVEYFQESNGVGGLDRFDYTYEGAQTDLHGRGFLGFAKRTIKDQQTGFLTTETYRQAFPFIGVPQTTVVTQSSGTPVEKVFNHWRQNTIAHSGGRDSIYRYLKDTVAIKYDLSGGSVLAQVTEDNYNLSNGTLNQRIVATGDGFSGAIDASYSPAGVYAASNVSGRNRTVTTDYQYNNNATNWRIGFVARKTDTYSVPGASNQVVVTGFTPYSSNTFLTRTEEQFVGTNQWITNTYVRDGYGNITGLTITAADIGGSSITSRNTTWGAYTNGMYPISTTNDLGHKTSFSYNQRIGKVSQSIDENSLIIDSVYDDFGRLAYQKAEDSSDTRIILGSCAPSCPANGKYKSTTTVKHTNQAGQGAPQIVQYFDAFNRELTSEKTGFNGQAIRVDTEYDSRGRIARISQPHYAGVSPLWTNYEYDVLSRVTLERQPDGGQTVSAYSVDPTYASRTTTTQTVIVPGAANKTITSIVKNNSIEQLVESIDADNTSTRYTYNAQGELSAVTVNGNAATSITIDSDLAGNKVRLVDPDAGVITYEYNGVGELRRQTQNPAGVAHTITTNYDTLGRVVSKVDAGNISATNNWVYDLAANGTGLLSASDSPDYQYTVKYDGLSRISETSTAILAEAAPKVFKFGYDDFSHQTSAEYPSGLVLKTNYNLNGYTESTSNKTTGAPYWTAVAADAYGNVTEEQYGNGLTTSRTYNPATGKLNSLNTGPAAAQSAIQDIGFQFDTAGNLVQRTNNTFVENFGYDKLHRVLTSITTGLASGTRSINYNYDALGNIKTKSDVSDTNGYHYGENGAGVHAVSRVVQGTVTTNYGYDSKGNMTTRGDNTIAYTVFNKPSSISKTGATTSFLYGPDREQIYRNSTAGGSATEHFYYGAGSFEVVKQGTSIREKTYIGDYLIYTAVRQQGGLVTGTDVRYLHRDNIGSVEAITDATGAQLNRMAFDPFGGRRQDSWENSDAAFEAGLSATTFNTTDRGFTNHEHVDDFELIQMKGRMYDPVIGRFVSPDDFVQFPQFSQSYNRYSYVLNNPLTHQDESGEFIITGTIAVFIIGSRIYSAYDIATNGVEEAKTALNENASTEDRVVAGLALGSRFVGGKVGNSLFKGAARHAKGVAKYTADVATKAAAKAKDIATAASKKAKAAVGSLDNKFRKWFSSKGSSGKGAGGSQPKSPKGTKDGNTESTIIPNKARGDLGEDAVRARLLNSNSIDIVGEQIRINTPGVGSHRVTDFLVRGKKTGKLRIIEVKTGKATRSSSQLEKDSLIADQTSATTFSGRRARAAGLPNGAPTGGIKTSEVNASNLNR